MSGLPRLRELTLPLRLGISALLMVLAGGYAASVAYVFEHHAKKDEEPGLTLTDLVGTYHGVVRAAPLRRVVDGPHGAEHLPPEDLEVLRSWLESADLYEAYDPLDSLEASPAEILDSGCLRCHARAAQEGEEVGQRIPLEDWSDVSKVAFSKRLEPVPLEILVVSTHAHALSMPMVGLVAGLLLLLTRWPRALRHGVFALLMLGLLADLGGMWLARSSPLGVGLLMAGGGLYGACLALAFLASLADLWLPGPRRP